MRSAPDASGSIPFSPKLIDKDGSLDAVLVVFPKRQGENVAHMNANILARLVQQHAENHVIPDIAQAKPSELH